MKTILKGRQVSSQGQWKTLICKVAVQVVQHGAETFLSLWGPKYTPVPYLIYAILWYLHTNLCVEQTGSSHPQ